MVDTSAEPSPATHTHSRLAQRQKDARSQDRDPGHLLARMVETPELARTIPHLPPEVLHKVIRFCGLEDCGALVAMATPAQLSAVFDLDLWQSPRPGVDEQFDAERFSVWLEVLLESGEAVAASALAAIDAGVVTAALAQYVHVFDRAALAPPASSDEDESVNPSSEADRWCDIGGYRVVARRHDTWDSTVALLRGLEAAHPDYFHRVMRACRSLSNSRREVDGLDQLLTEAQQVMFNCAVERERRREQQGYVTPAQASAFLRMSRALPRGPDSAPPSGNPIASAYFRAMEWARETDSDAGVAVIASLLVDAGVLPDRPLARLAGADGQPPRLARIQDQLEFARQRDETAYSLRNQELGYLANVLIAGCTIQARAFTTQEAFDAAFAVCNLGLENWPLPWLAPQNPGAPLVDGGTALPADFLVERDLVSVFQVGWTTLHEEVCVFAATRLMAALRGLRSDDREVQAGIKHLVTDLTRQCRAGVPWRARPSFDVIAVLDMPTWAALLGLVDECPTIHGAIGAAKSSRVRSVSSTAFEFIADNAQIASVREFLASLPERLRP